MVRVVVVVVVMVVVMVVRVVVVVVLLLLLVVVVVVVVVALVGVQVMTHLNRSFTGIFALLRTMLPPPASPAEVDGRRGWVTSVQSGWNV